jgi:hypothetical protein
MNDGSGMVQSEAVDMKLVGQINEILSEEMQALGMIKIDHGTPGGIPVEKLSRATDQRMLSMAPAWLKTTSRITANPF